MPVKDQVKNYPASPVISPDCIEANISDHRDQTDSLVVGLTMKCGLSQVS